MTELPQYTRWANVPGNLKTKTQLKADNLRPARGQEPVAVIRTGYGDWKLYDLTQAVPRQPASPERQAQLAAAREKADRLRTCPGYGRHCGEYLSFEDYGWAKKRHNKPDGWQYVCRFCRDRARAIEWAREVLADERAVILDSETTGLDEDSEIIEIAIINTRGETLFNSLINPHGPMGASHIHGIKLEDVTGQPSWPEIEGRVRELTQGASRTIVYNAAYDWRLVRQTAARYGITVDTFNWPGPWQCAMDKYAEFIGEWNDYHGSYRWQRLEGGDHRALGDCLACLEYIKKMAKSE